MAVHYYFSGNFIIPEFRDYRGMFSSMNSDMLRGIAQLHTCGPVYAGIGYSLAALIGIRMHSSKSSDLS
jgi:hypothetical protein